MKKVERVEKAEKGERSERIEEDKKMKNILEKQNWKFMFSYINFVYNFNYSTKCLHYY